MMISMMMASLSEVKKDHTLVMNEFFKDIPFAEVFVRCVWYRLIRKLQDLHPVRQHFHYIQPPPLIDTDAGGGFKLSDRTLLVAEHR